MRYVSGAELHALTGTTLEHRLGLPPADYVLIRGLDQHAPDLWSLTVREYPRVGRISTHRPAEPEVLSEWAGRILSERLGQEVAVYESYDSAAIAEWDAGDVPVRAIYLYVRMGAAA